MLTPGLVLTALVTLSLVGYPLAALFAIITGFENQDVSIALRVFVVGLGGGAILMSLAVRLNPKFDIALLGFIALYFVRLLHDAAFQVWDASDALLMSDVRALLVATVVRPALEAGRHLVTDRYLHSSIAYQGHGRGLDPVAV